MQLSLNRRFTKGLLFGVNYTRQLHLLGNTGLVQRLQHAADGTISLRSDEAAYEKLNDILSYDQPNYFVANAVWSIPGVTSSGRFVHTLTSGWQLSSAVTLHTGLPYTPGYSYQQNGGNVNITGSPDWGGKVVISNPGMLGSGCSGNRYAEFNTAAITGPTYGSVGMESGRNYLHNCPTRELDMNIVRRISIRERVKLVLRLDVFNVPNAVQISSISSSATFNNPTSMTLANNQYNGTTLNPARLTPATAGFGAATAAMAMRNVQLEARIQF